MKIRKNIFQASVELLAGTHALAVLTSLAYGIYGPKKIDRISDLEETFDSNHYQYVTDFVASMYGGKGTHQTNVLLDEAVTFEDPAASCSGPKEVEEAFRALKYIQPNSLSSPRCVDVKPKGALIELTYALNQRYLDSIELESLLVVVVKLKQMSTKPEENIFLIQKVEEQWNGVEPLRAYLFHIVRRINGIISYALTTNLLKGGN